MKIQSFFASFFAKKEVSSVLGFVV